MKLTEIGRKLSKKDILEMEAKIKFLFPKDYAAFLCETNGGVPEEDVEFSYRAEEPECDEETILGSDVQHFYNAEEAMEAYLFMVEAIENPEEARIRYDELIGSSK